MRLIDVRTLSQMHNADAVDGDHFRALKYIEIDETGKFKSKIFVTYDVVVLGWQVFTGLGDHVPGANIFMFFL